MKLIKDIHKNIINKVSFLAGIHTAQDVKIGCNENKKTINFDKCLLKFNFNNKKYIRNTAAINNNMLLK